MLKQEQISEWTENPVTIEVLKLIKSQLKEIEGSLGLECYVPGEPQKTQELLANLNGCWDSWEMFQTLCEGDWSYFDEEEDEE